MMINKLTFTALRSVLLCSFIAISIGCESTSAQSATSKASVQTAIQSLEGMQKIQVTSDSIMYLRMAEGWVVTSVDNKNVDAIKITLTNQITGQADLILKPALKSTNSVKPPSIEDAKQILEIVSNAVFEKTSDVKTMYIGDYTGHYFMAQSTDENGQPKNIIQGVREIDRGYLDFIGTTTDSNQSSEQMLSMIESIAFGDS